MSLVFSAKSFDQKKKKKHNFLPLFGAAAPWKVSANLVGTRVQISVAFDCFLFLFEGNNKGVGSSLYGLKGSSYFDSVTKRHVNMDD